MTLRSLEKPVSPLGRLLKHWRGVRRLSQLDLGLAANVSARHISFLETGRARPSREMVLQLARVLELPLREQNALLDAAGYARIFRETPLDDTMLKQSRRALEFILRAHEPNPCIVTDRLWNIQMMNGAATRVLTRFIEPSLLADGRAPNSLRLVFHPDGMRRFIVNWEEVAREMLTQVHREALRQPDEAAGAIVEEMLGHPGVPRDWSVADLEHGPQAILPVELRRDALALTFFTMKTTFQSPRDITLEELHIETFCPADAETEQALQRLAADARDG